MNIMKVFENLCVNVELKGIRDFICVLGFVFGVYFCLSLVVIMFIVVSVIIIGNFFLLLIICRNYCCFFCIFFMFLIVNFGVLDLFVGLFVGYFVVV